MIGNLGLGIYHDLRGRIPYYRSDWKDAINYRVIPSTIFVYFTNILPALAFAMDMFDRTEHAYGVNEVLLSSALAGMVFGLFAGQPLCIVGVTGPISIFNYTIYDIIKRRPDTPYFAFMAWVCLWSMVMHFVIALFNWVNSLRFVTRFSCEIFGCFICIVYIQKGVEVLEKQFSISDASGYLSIVVALLTGIFGVGLFVTGTRSPFFHPLVRKFLADYGTPLCVVFFTGFVHFGRMSKIEIQNLPITASFKPTSTANGRSHGWFIHFWEISVADVFLAIPFAILLTILFYFDHNVSSLMCQADDFPIKKPSAFHWDFFLLGITTGVAGILGIPAPNGLIPQAPLHTASLCEVEYRTELGIDGSRTTRPHNVAVVEQRFSNFVQGLLTLGTMTRPLLVVLGLVPEAVLAGLFWIMGISGLLGNNVLNKVWFILSDKNHLSEGHAFAEIRPKYLYIFTIAQIIGTAAEVAITGTIAAIGFPAILVGFVAVGFYLPKIIPQPDMSLLDGPTASDHIMGNLSTKALLEKGSSASSAVEDEEEADVTVMKNESIESYGENSMRKRVR